MFLPENKAISGIPQRDKAGVLCFRRIRAGVPSWR